MRPTTRNSSDQLQKPFPPLTQRRRGFVPGTGRTIIESSTGPTRAAGLLQSFNDGTILVSNFLAPGAGCEAFVHAAPGRGKTGVAGPGFSFLCS